MELDTNSIAVNTVAEKWVDQPHLADILEYIEGSHLYKRTTPERGEWQYTKRLTGPLKLCDSFEVGYFNQL